jgi:mannose-6-phosphate isomerase-like protein (cupin superfamily)
MQARQQKPITPPQGGPPLHVHQREDEMFYVLEGEFKVQCADQTLYGEQRLFWQSFPGTYPTAFEM